MISMRGVMEKEKLVIETGYLAAQWCGQILPLSVLQSPSGYYIGTVEEGLPCTRESAEYWHKESEAVTALQSNKWTQRREP
jgi:hypothetical protein